MTKKITCISIVGQEFMVFMDELSGRGYNAQAQNDGTHAKAEIRCGAYAVGHRVLSSLADILH